jgi:hypothetical protein
MIADTGNNVIKDFLFVVDPRSLPYLDSKLSYPVALLQYISDSRNNVGDGDTHKIIRFEGLYRLATDNNQTIKTNNFA